MNELFTGLREVLERFEESLWAIFALTLDFLGKASPVTTGLLVLALAGGALLAARWMQYLLVRRLAARPGERMRWRELEMWFFLPAWPLLPFLVAWRGLRALWRRLTGWARRKRDGSATSAGDSPSSPVPFLAASLGPSFLLAGMTVALLHLLMRVTEPLLRAHLELAGGASVWEHLILGGRPELELWLPLARTAPHLNALLVFSGWMVIWWWIARVIRLARWRHLGRNLILHRNRRDVLLEWRDLAAVRHLVKPAAPYRTWAGTMVVAAVPLAIWGWFSLDAVPYRVVPGDLSVAFVVLLGWSIHLVLAGQERLPAMTPEADDSATETLPGWPEVRQDLEDRLQILIPPPSYPPRPVAHPRWSLEPLERDPLLSPLLSELIPEYAGKRRLTTLQHRELRRLARLGHVFTHPDTAPGELSLGGGEEREAEVRRRNRILFAPEGAGKTTLAFLAAANHALVHTRATLLVVRDQAAEEELFERIHRFLHPSTLRWTLRMRRIGRDLANDFSRGIVPDLLVTSLENLTVEVLQQTEIYGPFIQRLGLILIDDVESFAGNVETHAQLSFRRLTLAAHKLLGIGELGESDRNQSPLVLALGSESMDRAAKWVEVLVGIDAEVEHHSPKKADTVPGEEGRAEGQTQTIYRLSDFRSSTGEQLSPVDVVESCERLGVPWHFRTCGDGDRRSHRHAVSPRNEPLHRTTDLHHAAVVLLAGAWSEIRRELDRSALAGRRYPRRPCAILTLADPDSDMAFTQLDERLSLAGELASLPRPVLRPPSGRTVASHLAAELTQGWTEVEDVLETFGNATAHKLRELAAENLLLTERRVDVHERQDDYVQKVYVRAFSSAVTSESDPSLKTPLPSKVAQVELATGSSVTILDRTDLEPLLRVDADSAGLAYYPGQIFTHDGERYIVVHHATAEGGQDAPSTRREHELPEGSILVEPMLGDDLSSPRRRVRINQILASGEARRNSAPSELDELSHHGGVVDPAVTGHAFYGPDTVRIGDNPIQVELALVRLQAQHYSTYLLGPTFGEVRQRRLYSSIRDERGWETRLTTVALCIYPNPVGFPQSLAFREARLIAAAMRAVLPSMYRGAAESIGVALHIDQEDPQPTDELEPSDGFILFDLHNLGNGTARAIHRDGVELLLRLTRLYLERVLYHDRLLPLHDDWATGQGEWDLYAESGTDPRKTPTSRRPQERQAQRREQEAETRRLALEWLDSRLRPEGDAAASSGTVGQHRREAEPGEGDIIDIGRCWYSPRGSVADLVWAKHRWHLYDGDQAMLDIAFERRLADRVRSMGSDDPLLAEGLALHQQHLADPESAEDEARPWAAPREVWRVEGEDRKPHSSQRSLAGEELTSYHSAVAAWAAFDQLHLGPLARKLSECRTSWQDTPLTEPPAGSTDRYRLANYLATFVQGIPTRRSLDPDGPPALRSAVRTLLERRGSVHEKSLMLALLLKACGISAGLFVSFGEGRALTGAALPDAIPAERLTSTHYRDQRGQFASKEDSTGKAEHFARGMAAARRMAEEIESWREEIGLSESPPCWSVFEAKARENEEIPPAGGGPDQSDTSPSEEKAHLYVPIETAAGRPPGNVKLAQPDSWVFLPLVL